MSKLDKEHVIAEFTAAYKAAFGKEPQLEQKPGWFSVDGGKNIRLAELAELTQSYTASNEVTTAKKAGNKTTAPAKPAKKAKASKAIKQPATASRPLHQQAAAHHWADKIGMDQRMPRGAR